MSAAPNTSRKRKIPLRPDSLKGRLGIGLSVGLLTMAVATLTLSIWTGANLSDSAVIGAMIGFLALLAAARWKAAAAVYLACLEVVFSAAAAILGIAAAVCAAFNV